MAAHVRLTRWLARGLALGALLASACATTQGTSTSATAASTFGASGEAGAANAAEAERKSRVRARREATWAEYYADVMRRAKKHGGVVIWIAPPDVKRVEVSAR